MKYVYIKFNEAFEIYYKLMRGTTFNGIKSPSILEAALNQPRMSFDGQELYPTLIEKTAILGYSIIQGHPFVDGNKRIGQALIEHFLLVNGHEIIAEVEEQEKVILAVASGSISREDFKTWLGEHIVPKE